jgi:hypothetical protein
MGRRVEGRVRIRWKRETGRREKKDEKGERDTERRKRVRREREIGATVEEGIEKVGNRNLGKR